MADNFFEKLKQVRLFVFDVDGVWTDGKLLLLEDGSELRTMDVKDGFAAKRALEEQMKIVILSGKSSESLHSRFNNLGIHHIFMAENHKRQVLEQFLVDYNIAKHEVLTMGDDLPDRDMLMASGIATCPQDAAQEILNICDYHSTQPGGQGCVRDIIEKTLKVKEAWDY